MYQMARAAPTNQLESQLMRTIYIGNLAPEVLTEHVIEFFAPIGPVINIKMCPGGGTAFAHAFVEFTTLQHAQLALAQTGTMFMGRPVKVRTRLYAVVSNGAITHLRHFVILSLITFDTLCWCQMHLRSHNTIFHASLDSITYDT
jgi:hypothetical protein